MIDRSGLEIQFRLRARLYTLKKLILNRLKEPANLEPEIKMESESKIPSPAPTFKFNAFSSFKSSNSYDEEMKKKLQSFIDSSDRYLVMGKPMKFAKRKIINLRWLHGEHILRSRQPQKSEPLDIREDMEHA